MSERFEKLAKAVVSGRKIPDAPMVVLPGNPELVSPSEFDTYIPQIIEELQRQLIAPSLVGAARSTG